MGGATDVGFQSILRIIIIVLLATHTCTKRPPKEQPPPLTGRHGVARVFVAHGNDGNLSKDVGMLSLLSGINFSK